MVHLSIGFRSTSQTSRADRSKNRHLYSGNKTKPRKVRGRHQISSTVLMQWTFFVCDFAIQNLYVNLPYKICMWIPRTKLYVDLPYKISMWIPHTNSGCVREIFLLCPHGTAILTSIYTVKSAAGELFAALVGAVVRTCDLAPARSRSNPTDCIHHDRFMDLY